MIYAIAALAAVLVGFWILRPAYVRWRDYLQHAPELQDASFGTKVLVLFKGLRTKMLARFMDGLGVALPTINAIGEWLQPGGGIDLTGVLPSIPLPWAEAGSALSPAQYSPLVFLGLGRLTDYLRNHTTTPPNTIDPALAVQTAGNSNNVQGDTPSPALAAIVDPRAPLPGPAPIPAVQVAAEPQPAPMARARRARRPVKSNRKKKASKKRKAS
jgi:hypothetical protein